LGAKLLGQGHDEKGKTKVAEGKKKLAPKKEEKKTLSHNP